MFGLLPPSSSVTRFSALPALGADLAPDDGRAGERDLVDARVVDQRRAGLAVAGEDVERALGEARLERQLAEPQRVSGVCSAGLRISGQPAASAGAIFQIAISSGKFQGTIWAQTPTGSRSV